MVAAGNEQGTHPHRVFTIGTELRPIPEVQKSRIRCDGLPGVEELTDMQTTFYVRLRLRKIYVRRLVLMVKVGTMFSVRKVVFSCSCLVEP